MRLEPDIYSHKTNRNKFHITINEYPYSLNFTDHVFSITYLVSFPDPNRISCGEYWKQSVLELFGYGKRILRNYRKNTFTTTVTLGSHPLIQ